MDYIIETKNLTKQYGKIPVVKNIDIHVPYGKIYGLLGRNGAGKTTLMKTILKLVRPSKGKIKLFGADFDKNEKIIYSKIGSIVETPGFYGNLTGYENLRILGRLRGNIEKNEINNALEIVGLNAEPTKPFSKYSLGMKQRLGIAAAIMHNPELLILDEPINGLDPIGISEIRTFLSKLSREKKTTILISSHVLGEIEQIADIIGIMHKGQLVKEINMEDIRGIKQNTIEIEVDNPTVAIKILGNFYRLSNYSINGKTIKIIDCSYNCGELNKTLVEHGQIVTRLHISDNHLETYFSDLIGGGGIA